MRYLTALLCALLLSSTAAWSRTLCDSSATVIDSFSVSITLPSGFRGFGPRTNSDAGDGAWIVIIEHTSGGQNNYSISLPSISFTGSASAVDAMTTPEFFDLLAEASIERGIILGYTPCTDTTCDGREVTRVRQPACVTRSGSGVSTHFTPCAGSGCCTRIYNVCCPEKGVSIITLIGSESDGCGASKLKAVLSNAGCETTCPDGGGLKLTEFTR